MRFAFIARHRSIWPVAWLCDALDVSRSGFHAWLTRYIERFYNAVRRHSTIGYISPVEFEKKVGLA